MWYRTKIGEAKTEHLTTGNFKKYVPPLHPGLAAFASRRGERRPAISRVLCCRIGCLQLEPRQPGNYLCWSHEATAACLEGAGPKTGRIAATQFGWWVHFLVAGSASCQRREVPRSSVFRVFELQPLRSRLLPKCRRSCAKHK